MSKAIRNELMRMLQFTRVFVSKYDDFTYHCEETRNAAAKLRFYGDEFFVALRNPEKLDDDKIRELKWILIQIVAKLRIGLFRDLLGPPSRGYYIHNNEERDIDNMCKRILSTYNAYPFADFMNGV